MTNKTRSLSQIRKDIKATLLAYNNSDARSKNIQKRLDREQAFQVKLATRSRELCKEATKAALQGIEIPNVWPPLQ